MNVGVGLWCLQSTATAPRPFTGAYQDFVDDATVAERAGVHSIWLSEHHSFYDGYCPALLPAAAGALAVTSRIHVGTGVLLLPLQQSTRVLGAAQGLVADHGDRFHLGLGMGYRPGEFRAKDLDIADRVRRMTEGLDLLSADRPCPLWIGVTSQTAARRAGRRGIGLLISGAFSPEVVGDLIDAHRQAWEDADRPGGGRPPVGLLRNTWLVDTEAERRRAIGWVRSSYLAYAGLGWGAVDTGVDFERAVEASMEKVGRSAIVGRPEEVAERLAGYDVDLVICRIAYDQPPRSALVEAIERIGADLVPRIAGVGVSPE